ncbi:MAG: hypothetical protein VYA34_09200 [Myxococcota bacterium]|nr:hypothetical protein [Myxococcota bacterium]
MSQTPLQVNKAQAAAVEKMAHLVVKWGLTVPAILALESMRPLSFVGSQFMHLLSPVVGGLVPFAQWDEIAKLMEDRRGVEYVITAIEKQSARPSAPTPSEVIQ